MATATEHHFYLTVNVKVYKNLKQADEIIKDHSAYVNTASLLSQRPRPRPKLTAKECFAAGNALARVHKPADL